MGALIIFLIVLAAIAVLALVIFVWAALIAIVIGAGFLLWFAGLVVAVPVIGHATWHAYRALVE